jgi:hypothetical protein
VEPLWKIVWRSLTKLEIKLLYDPAIPYMGKYPKELKSEDICTHKFLAALFTIAKIRNHLRCLSTEQWKKRMWFIHPIKYYSGIR